MEITEEDRVWREECLRGIKDERRQSGHVLHKLLEVLVIGLTSIRAGWDACTVREDLGKVKERFFRRLLALPQGIPDAKTFARVFSWIEPGAVLSGLQPGLRGVNKGSGRPIHMEGKRICGSALQGRKGAHSVSAWVSGQNILRGPVSIRETSNESTAIPERLDPLEVNGDKISIEAMGCPRDSAAKIREQAADEVVSVKATPPGLYGEIQA